MLTKSEVKKRIVEKVESLQGCKATELAFAMTEDAEVRDSCDNLPDLFDELVEERELIEVEYVLPNMEWRVKSYFFPKGTELSLPKHMEVMDSRNPKRNLFKSKFDTE